MVPMDREIDAALARRLHPDVLTEYKQRITENPLACNAPLGPCHNTAKVPRPEWCAKQYLHEGNHAPQGRYDERKRQIREAVRRHREHEES